ncbi:hypothetical protein ACVNIS_16965 [Sphaerotilaceae bacterium SBD11-9]
MSPLRTLAHVVIDPPPADWREQLAKRLGARPRRIGAWAELALFGARQCLDVANEATLPANAQLRLASLSGPESATRAIAQQVRNGPPMPFTFMQSQPSQVLAALGQHLAWQGDARFTLCRDRDALLQLAQLESGTGGVLFGWADEDLRTEWWRLAPR